MGSYVERTQTKDQAKAEAKRLLSLGIEVVQQREKNGKVVTTYRVPAEVHLGLSN